VINPSAPSVVKLQDILIPAAVAADCQPDRMYAWSRDGRFWPKADIPVEASTCGKRLPINDNPRATDAGIRRWSGWWW